MSLARVDRVASAAARLPGYMRRTRWLELLAAISAEVQEVEDMWLAMLASNAIDAAVGDQLDQIGALVAQPRGGALDVDYRRRIRAKVATNRSLGLVEDIVRLARLVVNDAGVAVSLQNEGVASYILALSGNAVTDDTAADLAAFMRKATSAGVRGVLESSTVDDGDAFTLDGPAGLGFVEVPTIRLADAAMSSGFDTVIGVRPEWLDATGADTLGITLEIVPDRPSEVFDESVPDVIGVEVTATTTIGAFEAMVASSLYLFVVSPSTVPGAFTASDDLPATAPSDYSAGGAFATARE